MNRPADDRQARNRTGCDRLSLFARRPATLLTVRFVFPAVLDALDTPPFVARLVADAVDTGRCFGFTPVALISSLTASDSTSTRWLSRSTSFCV